MKSWLFGYKEKREGTQAMEIFKREGKPDLAYHYSEGEGPAVMFCGGFRSDMKGTKALYLEGQCRARGQAFLRFDYSGHGDSAGAFADGTIGSWFGDARDMFDSSIHGPVIVVGSSMGGWIGLLLAKARQDQVKGLVGIAAAPDFTEIMWSKTLSDDQRATIESQGYLEEPNDYSDEPYLFTKALFEDGRKNLILNRDHDDSTPMHLLHGRLDTAVAEDIPTDIKTRYPHADVQITYIDDGDHRLSRPEDLKLIDEAVISLSI